MLKVFKLFRCVKSILDASSFCQARKRKAKSLDSPHSFLNLPDSSNTTLSCCISCETLSVGAQKHRRSKRARLRTLHRDRLGQKPSLYHTDRRSCFVQGAGNGVQAIIVSPMNALAN